MSTRAVPLPSPRTPVVHEGLGQHFHGDFFAASQMGGTAGGHGNANTTFNGGEGVPIQRLISMMYHVLIDIIFPPLPPLPS